MIQFVCFSRSRPLQLHGYLSSLADAFTDQEEPKVGVLVRADPPYVEAYAEVRREFPSVRWCHETNFGLDLLALVDSQGEYTCFGCDDVVFVNPIDLRDVDGIFNEASPIGLSLRLGKHQVADMFERPLPQPAFTSVKLHRGSPELLTWNAEAADSVGDWAYPWEVLGTIYPTAFVLHMLAAINATSPSTLEERGSRLWPQVTTRRTLACYSAPRIVVPTVNIVQTEFPGNGIIGPRTLDPEFLLDAWNRGLRLDTYQLADHEADSWRIGDFPLRRVT